MKKVQWSNYKERYVQQNKIQIKIPKDLSKYNSETQDADTEFWIFHFNTLAQEQILEIIFNEEDTEINKKDKLKNVISLFQNNVFDWENVKLIDMLADCDPEEADAEIEFSKEALDNLFAENMSIVPYFIQEVQLKIVEKRKKTELQKKT